MPRRVVRKRGVIDVLEFGSGNADWITHQARKTPGKLHVAVEHAWSLAPREQTAQRYYKEQAGVPPSGLVVTSSTTMERFIENMLRNNIVAGDIYIRMPDWTHVKTRTMDFKPLFRNVRKLLLRKGKITLTTENEKLLAYFKGKAWKAGLKVKTVPIIPQTFHEQKYSNHPEARHRVYGIELTLK
jgi:tRNA G46 methylase TrmB